MEFTMSKTFKIAGAVAVMLGLVGPVFAQVDVANMSCGQFMAMDQVGRDAAAQDMIDWVQCTANCDEVGSLTGILVGQEKKQVHQFIEARCGGQPADANVVTLLKQ
jgi:hypothetical protein